MKALLEEQLLRDFFDDFARSNARSVIENEQTEDIYLLATGKTSRLRKNEKNKVVFRAAYILEYIYFFYPEHFLPFTERFCDDFAATENESAKRHFTKMMRHLLAWYTPPHEKCEAIAEAAAEWVITAGAKVALQVNSIDVLRLLRREIEWIDDILPTAIETMGISPTPGMVSRLRRWHNEE